METGMSGLPTNKPMIISRLVVGTITKGHGKGRVQIIGRVKTNGPLWTT